MSDTGHLSYSDEGEMRAAVGVTKSAAACRGFLNHITEISYVNSGQVDFRQFKVTANAEKHDVEFDFQTKEITSMDHSTHILGATALAGALLIVPVNAGAVSPAGLSRVQGLSPIELVQDKQKPETVKHAAKRIWRNLTGYKFDVACLFTRTTCTETGKNREDARAKCQAQHNFCEIKDANR